MPVDLKNPGIPSERSSPLIIGLLSTDHTEQKNFLAGLYRMLLKGKRLGARHFAGSLTLMGWESTLHSLNPEEQDRLRSSLRIALDNPQRDVLVLLHLAFRKDKKFEDVLFTYAPGEWFTDWITNKDGTSAEGARWIIENSDAFILFADCAVLSNPESGAARLDLEIMSKRLAENLGGRPAAILWSNVNEGSGEHPAAKKKTALNEDAQKNNPIGEIRKKVFKETFDGQDIEMGDLSSSRNNDIIGVMNRLMRKLEKTKPYKFEFKVKEDTGDYLFLYRGSECE